MEMKHYKCSKYMYQIFSTDAELGGKYTEQFKSEIKY